MQAIFSFLLQQRQRFRHFQCVENSSNPPNMLRGQFARAPMPKIGARSIDSIERQSNLDQSSQKRSLRYLSAPSQSTVTITPLATVLAKRMAAATLAPEEMPTINPSSRASRLTVS